MNAAARRIDWTDANQRVLVAEFSRLKRLLEGSDDVVASADAGVARSALEQPASIDRLTEAFSLTAFERDLILLAAGVEMDSNLGARCAEVQGQSDRPWPTIGLALDVLTDPHWSALAPSGPLRRWRLVELGGNGALMTQQIVADERIVHFLAGLDYLDPRVQPLMRSIARPRVMALSQAAICEAIVARFEASGPPLPLVQLTGPDRDGREDIAAECADRLGLRLHAIDIATLPAGLVEQSGVTMLCAREAVLGASALLIDCADDSPAPHVLQLAERLQGVVFLAAPVPCALRRTSLHFPIMHPARAEQRALWQQALNGDLSMPADELDTIAAQFQLSACKITETATTLPADCDSETLWRACRSAAPVRLSGLAQRLEPVAEWDDLVLAPLQKQTLAQIAVHMRHRCLVYDAWGFAHKGGGLGVSALFAGESGTGKTMAAEVLARDLRLDLFRVDLSAVVSKYIGETEKNLRRVFDDAEASGAMLLFDEADALFGRRSEVKDSHDRYANIEVSYLLQRMETFRGLAILTTNQKSVLDTAFMRRLRFVVYFAFPDAAEREAIWRRAFPPATPLRGIAYEKLARLQVSGGQIRNIALASAFMAAASDEPVSMAHLLRAARNDSAKRERPLADAETRGWV